MNYLKEKIIKKIKSNKGYIPLDEYIKISMYDKNNGYYIKKNPIGRFGDFITAPEISQLFGEMLGIYIIDYWKNYIKKNFTIIELGPGRGTLLKDFLNIGNKYQNYLSKLDLILIEKNNLLKKEQKKTLSNNINNLKSIKWFKKINIIPKQETIIIANEFFDCLPIKQLFKFNGNYYEKIVKYNKKIDKLFLDKIKIKEVKNYKTKIDKTYILNNFIDGDIIEISFEAKKYIEKISNILLKNNGIFILIDYGNYSATGFSSIQSIKKHNYSNFLENVGRKDLTYMLDFAYFKKEFVSKKLNTYGPFTQKDFFISLGIKERKNKILKYCSISQKKIIESGYDRIIGKNNMGELYKVLIISSRKLSLYEK